MQGLCIVIVKTTSDQKPEPERLIDPVGSDDVKRIGVEHLAGGLIPKPHHQLSLTPWYRKTSIKCWVPNKRCGSKAHVLVNVGSRINVGPQINVGSSSNAEL